MRIKRRISSLFAAVVVLALLLGSCIKKEDFAAIEQKNIDDFIANNPTLLFTQKESGLYYYEAVAGTGDALRAHDTVYVVYTGKFLNGSIFDTNVGKDTLSFPVGENEWVIPGFDEGVSYMKKGSRSIFIIPSSLAYGPTGYMYISGYTPLLFEVTLGRIVKGPGK